MALQIQATTSETAKGAVPLETMLQFMDGQFPYLMRTWFEGAAMGMSLVTSGLMYTKWSKETFRDFMQWLNLLHKAYPQSSKTLYRVLSRPSQELDKVSEGSVVKLSSGLNIVQSWTDSLGSAQRFYKTYYSSGAPEKGHTWVIAETHGQPITSMVTVLQVLEWLDANAEKYRMLKPDDVWLSGSLGYFRSWQKTVRTAIKRLKTKDIQDQREQVVYVPKPIRVKIVKKFVQRDFWK